MALMSSHTLDRISRAARHFEPSADDVLHDLSREISALRKQVAALADRVEHSGSRSLVHLDEAAHHWSDIARHRGSDALREFGHQADRAGHEIRRNPLPVLAVLGTIVLVGWLVTRQE